MGDTVIVKPNERLAADGFIVKGDGSIIDLPLVRNKWKTTYDHHASQVGSAKYGLAIDSIRHDTGEWRENDECGDAESQGGR